MPGDVEDFLRKLIEKQLGQAPGQRPAQAAGRPAPQRPAQPPRRQPAPVRRPVPQVLDAEIIEDQVEIVDVESIGSESVAGHVARHLDNREFESRSDRLGAGVRQEENQLQDHIRQAIGSGPQGGLSSGTPSVSATAPIASNVDATATGSPPASATQFFEMLRSPQDFRRAFILGEILKRPDFDSLLS